MTMFDNVAEESAAVPAEPGALRNSSKSSPRLGVVEHRIAPGNPEVGYYLYVPAGVEIRHPVLVTVHGISRNAREHIEAFVKIAKRRGAILVAPYFDHENFSDFQRLGRVGRGHRADKALRRILDDVANLTSVGTSRFLLYGHSGGGQFVHRYVMAHPKEIIRYAVSSSGWYTLPDLSEKFPRGMKPVSSLPGVEFSAEDFLRVPGCIFVGDRDTERDDALNKSPRLDATQGRNRVERAQSWVSSMVTAARWRGFDTPYLFKLLPHSDHDFTHMVRKGHLVKEVSRCLLE